MKCKDLLKNLEYECVRGSVDVEVTEVVNDSRKVTAGCLFLCIVGANFDGHDAAPGAVEAGAKVLVASKDIDLPADADVTVIKVADTRYAMAFISAAYFGNPADDMKIIGVTGTKGKTTTTYIVKSILENAGHKVGLVGTIEAIIGDKVIPADNTTPESHTVIKDTTAWLLTSAMEDVMTSGTGTSAYFGSSMAQAGKSGTTTSSRDALFAGYTPYYTCAVWGGYDDNAMQKGSDTNYPKRIWKAVMKRIHENLAYKDFTKPSGIVAVAVCKESGKLPIEGVCDHDPRGNCVITEYFAQGTEPTEYCDHHTVANICTASNMLAGSYCPAETVTTGVYVIGGSETTEDAPYLLTDAFLSQTCTVHNEFNSTYTGTNSFPGSTGVNPIGADPAGDASTPDASTTTTDPAATTDQSVDGQ